MPGSFILRRALVAAALVCASALPAAAQPFTSLTFFGDSFTDTGNGDIIAGLLGLGDLTPTPPYAPGRASNGLLYADYLAASLGHAGDALPSLAPAPFGGRNFAIGTARTGLNGAAGTPVGMLSQLGSYPAAATDPTGLYVLFGGSNDVFDAALLGSPAAMAAALNTAVNNLGTIAQTLYGYGARRFLVPNIGNVGLAPLARAQGPAASALLGALSAQFNTLLGAKLGTLGTSLPGSTFYGLHLDTLFDNILYDASTGGTLYGLTNVTVQCLPDATPLPVAPTCTGAAFADSEHPTTAVHQLIARAAFNRVVNGVDVSAVPEPATLVLLGGGLCVLGVAGALRRRAV